MGIPSRSSRVKKQLLPVRFLRMMCHRYKYDGVFTTVEVSQALKAINTSGPYSIAPIMLKHLAPIASCRRTPNYLRNYPFPPWMITDHIETAEHQQDFQKRRSTVTAIQRI